MKRLLVFVIIIVVLFIAFVYIFIPENIIISKVSVFNCAPNAIYRHLSEQDDWKKWFTDNQANVDSSLVQKNNLFIYNGDSYVVTNKNHNIIELKIKNKKEIVNSNIYIVQLPENKAAVQWQCNLVAGINPLQRIIKYMEARKLKNNISHVLDAFNFFLSKKENAYGMDIELSSTKDTLLIAAKKANPAYPTTADVYDLISKLKIYIAEQGASITGYPMLNVTTVNDHTFDMMVAIPINKLLPNKDGFEQKRLVPGNFMTAQITGGNYNINEALKQMELYFQDNSKLSMAIPFQSLITDRIKENDTSKWVTKIYAPVFR